MTTDQIPADEHVHDFNQPEEIFEGDGVTHKRIIKCDCGESVSAKQAEKDALRK